MFGINKIRAFLKGLGAFYVWEKLKTNGTGDNPVFNVNKFIIVYVVKSVSATVVAMLYSYTNHASR